MKFSLLCPSRERPNGIKRLLSSLDRTIQNKQNVQILIAIDEDDIVSQSYLIDRANIPESLMPNFSMHVRPRSEFLNRDYYNWLALQAAGDYLWAIGDDVEFLVHGWDIHIQEVIEAYLKDKPDRIFCASIHDSTPKPPELPIPFPCFPLITKEAFRALGFLLHPEIPTWGADYTLYELYKGAGRILTIEDRVYLDHISHHTGKVVQDMVNKRIELIAHKYNIQAGDNNAGIFVRRRVPKQIEMLKKLILENTPAEVT